MSTATTTPEITPASSPEAIAAAHAAARVALPEPTPVAPVVVVAPSPDEPVSVTTGADGTMEVKLKTGEVFKGPVAEVIKKMGEAHVSTKTWAQTEVEKAKQAAAPVTPAAPAAPATPSAEEAARTFILDEVAKALNLTDGNALKQSLGRMTEVTEAQMASASAGQFMAECPDFPNTKEAGEKLSEVLSSLALDPYNPKHLAAAHAECVRQKAYAPLTPEQIKATTAGTTRVAQATAPPMIEGGNPDTNASPVVTPSSSLADIERAYRAAGGKLR